jgi:hypothetical protein
MRSKPCAGCLPVYALETDSLAEAAGFEPSHLRSEFSKTFSLGTGLDRIADARASLLNKVSGVPSDGQIRSSADLISRCRGSSPAASASQSVSNVLKRTSREIPPRGGISHVRAGLGVRKLATEAGFRRPVSIGDILVSLFWSAAWKCPSSVAFRPVGSCRSRAFVWCEIKKACRAERMTTLPD